MCSNLVWTLFSLTVFEKNKFSSLSRHNGTMVLFSTLSSVSNFKLRGIYISAVRRASFYLTGSDFKVTCVLLYGKRLQITEAKCCQSFFVKKLKQMKLCNQLFFYKTFKGSLKNKEKTSSQFSRCVPDVRIRLRL